MNVGQQLLGAADFVAHGGLGGEIEAAVGPGVIADFVAGDGDGAGETGVAFDVLAALKERRGGIGFGEEFQDGGGTGGGAIVEGEGDGLVGSFSAPDAGGEELGGASADGPGGGA